jgi:hypothetical protein
LFHLAGDERALENDRLLTDGHVLRDAEVNRRIDFQVAGRHMMLQLQLDEHAGRYF